MWMMLTAAALATTPRWAYESAYDNVAEGENVIMGDGVLVGIEGDEVAVNFVAPRELGFVVGLEG